MAATASSRDQVFSALERQGEFACAAMALFQLPHPSLSLPDSYVYNPGNPAPTIGGPLCCDEEHMEPGPRDQRPVENRDDVVVYSIGPLPRISRLQALLLPICSLNLQLSIPILQRSSSTWVLTGSHKISRKEFFACAIVLRRNTPS